MNRSRFLIPVTGAFCLALAVAPVSAQDIRSMRQSFQTSGSLTWGNQIQNVRRVRVELDEDGGARLKFDAQERGDNWGWREGDWKDWDKNLELAGVWMRDQRGIAVDLRGGLNGQIVVGTARISLDEGFGRPRPSELSLSGRVVRRPWDTIELGGKFSFDAWNGAGNNNGGNNRLDELSTIRRGVGQFIDGPQRSEVSRAQVELSRDGSAKITLNGERDWTFEGRWRQMSANRVELRLDTFAAQDDRGLRNLPGTQTDPDSLGGGEIRLEGTRIVSLRLSGTRGNRDFEARFEPQVNAGNNGGGWNGNGGWNGDGWNGGGRNRPGQPREREDDGEGWGNWTGGPRNSTSGPLRPAAPTGQVQERPRTTVGNPRRPVEPAVEETPAPIQASWRGETVLRRAGGDETINNASVVLEPNGVGRLRVGTHTLSGRWREIDKNIFTLLVENEDSRCTAEIVLNNGRILALSLTGVVDKAQSKLNITRP